MIVFKNAFGTIFREFANDGSHCYWVYKNVGSWTYFKSKERAISYLRGEII